MSPVRLPPELIAVMRQGISVIVGSRGAGLKPSIMRAVGSRVSEDGQGITLFLARAQSRQLLQDIAASGHVSAVFSQPSTHRTVQLKATRAVLGAAAETDRPLLAAYHTAMQRELSAIGVPAELTSAMLAHDWQDVVTVTFKPDEAFDQTPGPRAGERFAP